MTYAWLALVLLLLFVYPFIIYPTILAILPRKPFPQPSSDTTPISAALLFCAYNEEVALPKKIQNLRDLKQRRPALDIIAYSDFSSDQTYNLLLAASDVLRVYSGEQRLGKATGMRRLVASTTADIIVFTDANVTLDIDAVDRLVSYFRDPLIGTVAGTLHYTNDNEGQTAQVGSLFWKLEEYIKRLESATGSTMGADGSVFATRRILYPEVPSHLLDDLIASISPLFAGYRVVSAPDVRAFERTTTDSLDEFRRKRRIACRAYNTHRFLLPNLRNLRPLDKFKYMSHKYLRWFSFVTLVLFFVTATAALLEMVGLIVTSAIIAAGVVVLGCGYWLKLPVIGSIAEMLVSVVAVGIGVIEAMWGRTYQFWNPAKSRQ